MQAEVSALRGDMARLFLALQAAEARHQQELAGVIVDAAQHQTKVRTNSAVSSAADCHKPACQDWLELANQDVVYNSQSLCSEDCFSTLCAAVCMALSCYFIHLNRHNPYCSQHSICLLPMELSFYTLANCFMLKPAVCALAGCG